MPQRHVSEHLALSQIERARVLYLRVVSVCDHEAPPIAVELLDERPAPHDQALPQVERFVLVRTRLTLRAIDGLGSEAKRFSSTRAPRPDLGVRYGPSGREDGVCALHQVSVRHLGEPPTEAIPGTDVSRDSAPRRDLTPSGTAQVGHGCGKTNGVTAEIPRNQSDDVAHA